MATIKTRSFPTGLRVEDIRRAARPEGGPELVLFGRADYALEIAKFFSRAAPGLACVFARCSARTPVKTGRDNGRSDRHASESIRRPRFLACINCFHFRFFLFVFPAVRRLGSSGSADGLVEERRLGHSFTVQHVEAMFHTRAFNRAGRRSQLPNAASGRQSSVGNLQGIQRESASSQSTSRTMLNVRIGQRTC